MRLSHYSRNILFESFSPDFWDHLWAYCFQYVLQGDTKTCEKSFQKSTFFNSGIVS